MRPGNLKSRKVLLAAVAFIAVITAAAALVFQAPAHSPAITANALDFSDGVSVNGERITKEEINRNYEKLPPENRLQMTKENATEILVNERLLLQEASKKGIAITDEEAGEYIDNLMAANGVTEAYLEEQLLEQGYTLDEYIKNVQNILTISELLNQELQLQDIQVSEAEIDKFMQENSEEMQFILEENDPGLESQLRSRVKYELLTQKQQEIISDYIKSLRAKATIEY